MRKRIVLFANKKFFLSISLVKPRLVWKWINDADKMGPAGSLRTPVLFFCYVVKPYRF